MRWPGARADLQGEHRRLDRGRRHRADRAQRVPARARHRRALARRARASARSSARASRRSIVGDASPYVPLVALGGAAIGGMLGQTVGDLHRQLRPEADLDPAAAALARLRGRQSCSGSSRASRSAGRSVRCCSTSPARPRLRRLAQESRRRLRADRGAAAASRHGAVERIDPFAAIAGPRAGVAPPGPDDRRCDPDVRAARRSVVRITRLRVRARHRGLRLDRPAGARGHERARRRRHRRAPSSTGGAGGSCEARVVSFDAHNDVAILRVPGLQGGRSCASIRRAASRARCSASPRTGPYRVTPVRMGRKATGRLA